MTDTASLSTLLPPADLSTTPIATLLHPPRLPVETTTLAWPDLLAAFGLGLLVAALAAALLRPLLRPRPRRLSLTTRVANLGQHPADDRILGQLHLLAERGIPLPEDLRAALYQPTPPDPAQLDALILHGRPDA